MHELSTRLAAGAVALLVSAGFAGCVVAPYRTHAGGDAGLVEAEVVTTVAPPPVRVQTIGVAPFLGAVWIAGYWNWRAGRHHWVPGHWERPRAGHRWAPRHWHHSGNRWHLRGGGWVRG